MPRSSLNSIKYFILVAGVLATFVYGAWLVKHDRNVIDGGESAVAFVTAYLLCSILLLVLNGLRKSDVAVFTYTLTMMALNGQILVAEHGLAPFPYFATAAAAIIGMLAAIIPLYISNVRQAAQFRRASDSVSRKSLSGLQLAAEMGMAGPSAAYCHDGRIETAQSGAIHSANSRGN